MGELCSRHGRYVNSTQTSTGWTSRQDYCSYLGRDAVQVGKYFADVTFKNEATFLITAVTNTNLTVCQSTWRYLSLRKKIKFVVHLVI
jgi:hypothetical protein